MYRLLFLSFEWVRVLLYTIGFIFLIYIGWLMWKDRSELNDAEFSPKRQITFAASVSLLNPHAILDTIGVIGTNSLLYQNHEKWIFTIACIVVSWVWFFVLAMLGKELADLIKMELF